MKQKNILLIFIVLFGFSINSQAQCDVTNGLIHHYPFDGNTNDVVGTANGVLSGNNQMLYTNGTLRSVIGAESIKIPTVTVGTDFTISFWFKPIGRNLSLAGSFNRVGTYYDSTSNTLTSIGIAGDDTSTAYSSNFGLLGIDNAMPSPFYPAATAVDLIYWSTDLYTFVKTGNSITLYKNEDSITTRIIYDTVTQMNYLFGELDGFVQANISGFYDDYRIYNRAITANEVSKLFRIRQPIAITNDIDPIHICPADRGQFLEVVATNALTYTWLKDSVIIAHGSESKITFVNPTASDSGTYQVIATSDCGVQAIGTPVQVTFGYLDLNSGLVAYYSNALNSPTPSNSALGNLVTSGSGISYNTPNRFNAGHPSTTVTDPNTSLLLQNNFSDATSSTSFWYQYNTNNYLHVRHMVRTTNGNTTPVVMHNGKVGLRDGTYTWSANQVFTTGGDWYHIVLVRDGASHKIYVNGNLVVNKSNALSTQAQEPITGFGGHGASPIQTAIGAYDDVRFYDYPVGQKEVDLLYNDIVISSNVNASGYGPSYLNGRRFCEGSTAVLKAGANTSDTLNPIQYQWYKGGVAVNNTANIKGARTSILTIESFSQSDTGSYYCQFVTQCQVATTPAVPIIYSSSLAPTVTISTIQPKCVGANGTNVITLSGTAGPAPTIQYIYTNTGIVTSPHTVAPGRITYGVVDTTGFCNTTKTVTIMNPTEPVGVFDEFSTNNCNVASAAIAVNSCDSVSGNQWHHLMNDQGKVVASINPNGQNIGNVTATLFNEIHSLSEVLANNNFNIFGAKYMQKTWVLDAANSFSNPVNVRFYYMREDLDTLAAAAGCPTCNSGDLILSHLSGTNEDCNPTNSVATNFNLYWNKNVPNPAGDKAMIMAYVSGNLDSLYHNTPLNTAGGSNSDGRAWNGQYFEAAVNQFSEFRLHMVSAGATPLPVNWLAFDAYKQSGQVVLDWQVANEENCKQYRIERSRDGFDWNQIATIDRKQNGLAENDYLHYDMPQENGTYLYRILQEDVDGRISYSNTRLINYESATANFKLYPNPTNGEVFYKVINASVNKGKIEVRSMMGQLLLSEKADEAGRINLSSLPAGVYFVQHITNDKKEVIKLIKK